jgi:hypothetical protein
MTSISNTATRLLINDGMRKLPPKMPPRMLSPSIDVVSVWTMKPTMPRMMKSMTAAMTRLGVSASATPPGPGIVPWAVRLDVHEGIPLPGWPPAGGGGAGCCGVDCQLCCGGGGGGELGGVCPGGICPPEPG